MVDNSALVRDVQRALQGVTTAIHYMHETGGVESQQLDRAHESILNAQIILESYLEGEEV